MYRKNGICEPANKPDFCSQSGHGCRVCRAAAFRIGRSCHMYEDFGTILNRGFKTWVRNLNICIPFVLNFFVNLTLSVFFIGLLGVLLFTSGSGNVIDPTSLSEQEIYSVFWEGFTNNILTSVVVILVFFLLGMFLQAFFTAGAIGMAKKASETGDTVFSDMLRSGSKNAFRLFLTTLIIALMLLAGIVFIVPGALIIGDLSSLIQNPEVPVRGIGVLIMGILFWAIYILAVNIVLSLAPYALVIDELDPLDALKTGHRFFRNNKLDVFFIWIISIGLAFINGFIGEFLGSGSVLVSGLTYLIPILILQPLTAVLWTRLYLTGEGRELYNPYDLLSDPERF